MAKKPKNWSAPTPGSEVTPGQKKRSRKGPLIFALIAVGFLIAVIAAPSSDTSSSEKVPATPAGQVQSAVTKQAGKSTNLDGVGGDRIKSVYISGGTLTVEMYGDENLSEGLTKSANRRLVLKAIKGIQNAGVSYTDATITVFYPLVDKLGNTSVDKVLSYSFSGAQISKINTDNVDTHNMDSGFADLGEYVHSAFAW